MRVEMNRLFERFEHGWPRLPNLFSRGVDGEPTLPEFVSTRMPNRRVDVIASKQSQKFP